MHWLCFYIYVFIEENDSVCLLYKLMMIFFGCQGGDQPFSKGAHGPPAQTPVEVAAATLAQN